jgi:crotonobetaine/carnitine-CoA ligase
MADAFDERGWFKTGDRVKLPDKAPATVIIAVEGAAVDPQILSNRIIAACKAALADFKVPHEVRIVDEMPRSTLEDVAKPELRRLLEAA